MLRFWALVFPHYQLPITHYQPRRSNHLESFSTIYSRILILQISHARLQPFKVLTLF
ncbi:hypothetical protein [Fischerella thermalis]|uniref:hypothetical protein n=1 Tax=Fischerella thermalis TaxID=372787 RepID=UPI00307CDDA9